MNKDEALRLALEALEEITRRNQSDHQAEIAEEAITAIKEALAQREQDGECKYCTDGCPACDARKLPEQEPVTWRNAAIRVGEDLCSVGPFRYYDMTAEQWLDWALSVVTVHAPPPQRTWVELDEEDYIKAYELCDFDKVAAFEFFEAALKAKNT
jgi:hypothetical protein